MNVSYEQYFLTPEEVVTDLHHRYKESLVAVAKAAHRSGVNVDQLLTDVIHQLAEDLNHGQTNQSI